MIKRLKSFVKSCLFYVIWRFMKPTRKQYKMKNSFLEDSFQLRTAATNGSCAALRTSSSKQRCRKDAMNLFFTTRPITDDALLRELSDNLIPTALSSCAARSSQLTLVLRELIHIVMHRSRTRSETGAEVTPWQKALYVILRTSLIREAKLMVPRLFLSPDSVRIAESIGIRAQQNVLHSWSGELDPVLSALVNANGATSDSVVMIQQYGRRGFADSSFSDASPFCSSVGPQSCGAWNMDVFNVVAEEEAAMQRYESQHESLFYSPLVEAHQRHHIVSSQAESNMETRKQRYESRDATKALTDFLRPGAQFFRMCVQENTTARTASQREIGMFLVAAHFAISGSPDPYGVVIHSRSECIGGTSLPRLIAHPDLILKPPNFQNYSAAMFGVRGVVSLLEAAAEWGNVLCSLRAIVKRSDSPDVIAAIGTIGIAAVKGLQGVLQYLTNEVAISQSLVGQRVAAVSPQEVLQVWTRRLVPITDAFATLADTFAVNINDKTWSSSKSLNQCGSTQFLTRLYQLVTQQNPAQHAARSLIQWRRGKPFSRHGNNLSATTVPNNDDNSTPNDVITIRAMELVAYMFHCGMRPFCSMTRHWLLTGDIAGIDPFDEFFIVPSYGETISGYRLVADRLPCFVSPTTAANILAAGVARSVFLDSLKSTRRNISSSAQHSPVGIFGWARAEWALQFDTAHERIISSSGIPTLLLTSSGQTSDAVAQWESYLLFCVEPLIDDLRWSRDVPTSLGDDNVQEATQLDAAEVGDDNEEISPAASSRSSVEAQPPSSMSDSQETSKHRDSSVGFSESTDPFRFFMPTEALNADLRKQAAVILEAEHAAKMKILKFQEAMIRWRTRRLGLKLKRAVARRDELEFIKDMYASHPAHGIDHERLTPVGIFVVPLRSDFPLAPEAAATDEVDSAFSEDASPQLSVRLSLADDLDAEFPLTAEDHHNDAGILHRQNTTLEHDSQFTTDTISEHSGDNIIHPVLDNTAPPPPTNKLTNVFAPIPMSEEEYLEAQHVGISSSHYHNLRIKHAVEEYDAREALIQELNNEISDVDHYTAACAEGCRTDAFQHASSWAQTIGDDSQWLKELNRGDHSDVSPSISSPSLQLGSHVDSLLHYKTHFSEVATSSVAVMVPRTLFFLLSPTFGVAAHLARSLRRVCLLQGSSEVTSIFFHWELAAFSTDERVRRPSLRGIYDTMREGFSRMWSNAWITSTTNQSLTGSKSSNFGLPATCPLTLKLSLSEVGFEQCEKRATATPFDLLPLISVVFRDDSVDDEVSSETLDECLLLLPPHAAKRYSDLFVSLIFWRWAQRALDVCWTRSVAVRSARHHHREIWLFCTLARSVISIIVEYVWYGAAQYCKIFDAQCEDRVAIAGMTSLDDFILLHDNFLTMAYDAALLGPQYSRARQQIRIMVQLVERVYHFLSVTPEIQVTDEQLSDEVLHLQKVQRKQLLQHAREFWSAANIFAEHLTDTVEASVAQERQRSSKAVSEMVTRINIALASCRLS
ncbi:Hypothetical protein, putative [Bodo saltans]|uniref:Uncharacterized protein n=1 Tax=Bodo saltans TaxID=75058 RepID=A0A0S4JSP4_BODSA|nr:Hypothetical protein, putative [Bodo saltans]|eukprot:CUG93251.1 Hypothetical protein, putative [Bodo saltans]